MFLDNKSKVIKENVDNKYDYIIYVSTLEECNQVINETIKCDEEIIAHGSTNEITEDLAQKLLPEPKFINNLLTKSLINSYKCWACDQLGIDQHIAHLSAVDSWQCLLDTMGHPEYIIIIQKLNVKAETI